MEKQYTAGERDAGTRVDLWLCAKLGRMSRRRVKALLDGGKIFINGKKIMIAGWKLSPGDKVSVGVLKQKPRCGGKNREVSKITSIKRLKIYFEDRDLIVVEKPAGMITTPPEGDRNMSGTLLSEVHSYLRRRFFAGKSSFVAPLHRLDAETSGLVAFAISKIGQRLSEQFKTHSIRREYTAIVSGAIPDESGVIDSPLEKGDFHSGKKVRGAPAGKGVRATTEYRIIERYNNASVLSVRVRTGRTHQIRVHLAERGFPILGDKLYSDNVTRDLPKAHRHSLHACLLEFRHPASGKKLSFRSPLPKDMRRLIDELRGD